MSIDPDYFVDAEGYLTRRAPRATSPLEHPMSTTAEQLDELLAMARESGRASSALASAEHAHASARPGVDKRRAYDRMRAALSAATRAEAALARARKRFLARGGQP